MSLFRRLFGGRPRRVDDGVWLTTSAKHRGIQRLAEEALSGDPASVVILAHFPSTLERLRAATELPAEAQVMLARDALQCQASSLALGSLGDQPMEVLVVERHPSRHFDDELARHFEQLPNTSLRFHLSLEDPLLESFAGPWVESILSQMGMDDGDMIESSMIGRRIEQAQRKLCQGIEHEERTLDAASPEEWMAINGRQQ